MKDTTTLEEKYIVTFGPKNPKLRESKTFYDIDSAGKCFREKEAANLYVDVYKEEVVRTLTKLTS